MWTKAASTCSPLPLTGVCASMSYIWMPSLPFAADFSKHWNRNMKSFLLIDSLVLWAAAGGMSRARPSMFTGADTGLSLVISPVPAPAIPPLHSLFPTVTNSTPNLYSQG